MTHNLAEKLADKLVEKGADTENRDVLVYGFECALNEIIANTIIFTFAFIIGRPLEMLVWNVFMLPVRVSLGGHHAKSYFVCLAYSSILAIGCILVYPFLLHLSWLVFIEIALTLAVAFTFAPYIHPNHPVSEEHRLKIRRYGKIIAVTESSAIVLLFLFTAPWISQIAGLGMATSAILCIIGKCRELFAR